MARRIGVPTMKLGLGLYPHQFDLEHYRFARQCGCTHLMLHLTDAARLSRLGTQEEPSVSTGAASKAAGSQQDPWTYDALARLTEQANSADLQVECVDHLDPALGLGSVLGGSYRARSMEKLKRIIRNVGRAGIPVLAYHFWWPEIIGYESGRFARGDAETRRWAPLAARRYRVPMETRQSSTRAWNRLLVCLDELLTVAEGVGVTLAAPADEPWPLTPPDSWQDQGAENACEMLMRLHSSPRHGLMFSVADTAATADDVYSALETCSQGKRIACLRFGNGTVVKGSFHETFVDDGGVDMPRVVRILQANRYDGLIVPGRMPRMSCAAPWHAGVAHALGYLQAALHPPARKV